MNLIASGPRRRVRYFTVAVAGLLSTGLGGCSTVSDTMPPIETAPLPAQAPMLPVSYIYRIRIGDVLDIKFPLNPELNDEVTVGPDGRVSTADVEDLLVVGRAGSDVSADLRKQYSSILREPRLSVTVKNFAPAQVFVGGEVVNPGEFQGDALAPTLSQVVARAGGLKLSANPNHVFVIRRGADDKPVVYATRYQDVIRGDPTADVRLAPYDVVYVPRTTIAEVFVFFNQYVQQFVPVSWGFSYLFNNQTSSTYVPTTTTK
jgi:polysaccharide export outer membrane protein